MGRHDRDEPVGDLLGLPGGAPAPPRGTRREHHQHRVDAGPDRLRGLRRLRRGEAGLVLLTKQIAVEYGPAVRANVIAPGSIDTPRFRKVLEKTPGAGQFVEGLTRTIPARRLGVAEDVAAIALFLASDQSAYVSGAVIPADGGLAVYR